jgi:hypothetical protein
MIHVYVITQEVQQLGIQLRKKLVRTELLEKKITYFLLLVVVEL